MARRKGGQRGASRLKEKETAALDYTRRLKLSVASAPRDISTTRRLAAGEGAAGARYRWKERRPANTGMADRQWSLLQLPRGTSQRDAATIAQGQAERQGGQEGAAGAMWAKPATKDATGATSASGGANADRVDTSERRQFCARRRQEWCIMADRLEAGTSIRSDISKQIALAAVAIYAIIVLVAVFTV